MNPKIVKQIPLPFDFEEDTSIEEKILDDLETREESYWHHIDSKIDDFKLEWGES